MATARTEIPVGYKTTIVRTIIQAMRAVFTADYPESQFANLNVVNEFPLTEVEYPAIVVKFRERTIPQAGVGHTEYFNDPDGNLRKWGHRRFEGSLEFTICALSPLDRDVLSNALVEMISFGRLDALLDQFYIKVYGDIGVNVGVLGLLHQISMNTDIIQAMGDSTNIAPWKPEDTLVYTNAYSIQCNGGFYNSLRSTGPLMPIQTVIPLSYVDDDIPLDDDPGDQWSFTFDYQDEGVVTGIGSMETREDTYDAATVIGVAVISDSDTVKHPAAFVANRGTAITSSLVSNLSFTTTGAIAAGGKLLLAVNINGTLSATTATVSGGGLTWNKISQNGLLMLFEADAPAGVTAGTTITMTPDHQITRAAMSLSEWTNCATGIPVANHMAQSSGNSQNLSVGPTVDSAALGDGVFACWFFNNEALTFANWTAGTGYTKGQVLDSGGASQVGLVTEFKSDTAAGAQSAAMTTTDFGQAWGGIIVILARA